MTSQIKNGVDINTGEYNSVAISILMTSLIKNKVDINTGEYNSVTI